VQVIVLLAFAYGSPGFQGMGVEVGRGVKVGVRIGGLGSKLTVIVEKAARLA